MIVVDERPEVFWGRLKERNYRFLRGIDPGFWSYQASVHAEHVHDPEEGQRAAGALRIVYGQGVETLLALLASAAQTPHFPLGWMSSNRIEELWSVTAKIQARDQLLSPWGDLYVLGGAVSGRARLRAQEDLEKHSLVQRFGRAWASIAHQFLEPESDAEAQPSVDTQNRPLIDT